MTADALAGLRESARELDGLFVGMCHPEEYEHLIEAGLLRLSYAGVGGFMGLAKLRLTELATAAREER